MTTRKPILKKICFSRILAIDSPGTGARRVVSRLNRSDQAQASPVFVGVFEDDSMIALRKQNGIPNGDVGKMRFKDENPSKVYEEAVKKAGAIIEDIEWGSSEKMVAHSRWVERQLLALRFIAIRFLWESTSARWHYHSRV
jgi:hypothetical protein